MTDNNLNTIILELKTKIAEIKAELQNVKEDIEKLKSEDKFTGVYLDGVPDYAVEYIKYEKKKEGE